jgi:outer membrane lipoprotein LolB
LLAASLSFGCATLAPIETADSLYTGRFAATITDSERRDSASGRFTLAVRAGGITLDLASPLGNTLARVHTADGRATLTAPQPDGSLARWDGANAEALAESALGWKLPVAGIADWIAGRPAPARAARVTPDSGPAQRIEQDGWVIVIDERFEDAGTPRRLTFDHAAGDAAPALRLRLVLDAPPATGPTGEAPQR